MATKNATKNGVWSDPTVWNGGTLPSSGDDVYANTFTVDIDQNVTVATIRTTSGSGITAGGGFTHTAGTHAIAITGGILPATHNGVTSTYILTLSGGAPTVTATVTASGTAGRHGISMTGGTPRVIGTVTGGTASAAAYAIVVQGTAVAIITGNVVGAASTATILIASTTCTLTVNGSVSGGSAGSCRGIWMNSAGTVNINGSITAGTQSSAHAVDVTTAGTLTTTGNITGGLAGTTPPNGVNVTAAATVNISGGTLTGGTGTTTGSANAVSITGAAVVTVTNCTLDAGSGTFDSAAGVYVSHASAKVTVTGGSIKGTGVIAGLQAFNGSVRVDSIIELYPVGVFGSIMLIRNGSNTALRSISDDNWPANTGATYTTGSGGERFLNVAGVATPIG
jgi:hypothetical protein